MRFDATKGKQSNRGIKMAGHVSGPAIFVAKIKKMEEEHETKV